MSAVAARIASSIKSTSFVVDCSTAPTSVDFRLAKFADQVAAFVANEKFADIGEDPNVAGMS